MGIVDAKYSGVVFIMQRQVVAYAMGNESRFGYFPCFYFPPVAIFTVYSGAMKAKDVVQSSPLLASIFSTPESYDLTITLGCFTVNAISSGRVAD
ncbi:MAG: hypothetical protein LKJ78_13060 [Serratia liquefaciens]|jgi:hypothetical protein|nr:hypothetical protein [Serratia liquefaciens]MCH4232332.1 hypothetical protein [Serratia liquefaciens]MCH4261416.1 hypothetical protein [Serratia liquefaciens]MCI1212991.1 hypothetical protein [Serratia liquefaciens]MCI1233856.1 hypothetical protein [Serratia liquefaciens]